MPLPNGHDLTVIISAIGLALVIWKERKRDADVQQVRHIQNQKRLLRLEILVRQVCHRIGGIDPGPEVEEDEERRS